MNENSNRLVGDILRAAHLAGHQFAIVRGHEIGNIAPSDIDLVAIDCDRFTTFIREYCEPRGLKLLWPIDRWYVRILRVVSSHPELGCLSIKIDIHRGEQWRGAVYLEATDILKRAQFENGLPRYSSGDALVANLFQWALNSPNLSDSRLGRVQANCQVFYSDPFATLKTILPCVPAIILDPVEAALRVGEVRLAARIVYSRRSLIWRALSRVAPIRTGAFLAKTVLRRLALTGKPAGLFVSIIGPDGAGKSTLIESLCRDLALIAPGKLTAVQHWRPGYLRPLANFRRDAQIVPTSAAPFAMLKRGYSRSGRIVSFLRFAYYIADYVLGYIFKSRPILTIDGFVLCDRYVEDFVIAPPRRSNVWLPEWLKRAVASVVPRPHLVFYLRAEAELLHTRKKEETLDELRFLVRSYDALWRRDRSIQMIDASRSVVEIQAQIVSTIARRYTPS